MATKKLVAQLMKDWLNFSPRKITGEEAESLGQSYYNAFRSYRDEEIKQAADDYMTNGEYFPPKPVQITSLVKNVEQGKHTRELIERYTCSMCKQKTSSITSEGVCLDCAGVPKPSYSNIKPLRDPDKVDYKMEGRIMCQECGKVAMCIKEPGSSGSWKCRDCYTGIDGKEIAANWRTVIRAMDSRKELV